MKPLIMIAFVMGLFTLSSCGQDNENDSEIKEDGMVGTSCYARPVVKDPNGVNVCITPESNWPSMARGEFWYSLLMAPLAKKATIEACKEANALDYGHKYGKSCYAACEEDAVTSCIPFTPNPDI